MRRCLSIVLVAVSVGVAPLAISQTKGTSDNELKQSFDKLRGMINVPRALPGAVDTLNSLENSVNARIRAAEATARAERDLRVSLENELKKKKKAPDPSARETALQAQIDQLKAQLAKEQAGAEQAVRAAEENARKVEEDAHEKVTKANENAERSVRRRIQDIERDANERIRAAQQETEDLKRNLAMLESTVATQRQEIDRLHKELIIWVLGALGVGGIVGLSAAWLIKKLGKAGPGGSQMPSVKSLQATLRGPAYPPTLRADPRAPVIHIATCLHTHGTPRFVRVEGAA